MNESEMDIYDWLNNFESKVRSCPQCGSDDVKYGIHDKEYRGFELSVVCRYCGHSETGESSGEDVKNMVERWHK